MPLIDAKDPIRAAVLLTRLPMPRIDGDRMAKSAWAYPLIGGLVGLIAGMVASLALWMGMAAQLAAVLALVTQVMITGAMHEDGLADSADGLWGGWTVERRLDIMKDSRIGSYGVIAMVLSLALRAIALSFLFAKGWVWGPLILSASLSRGMMPLLMSALPHARADGMSKQVGKVSWATAAIAVLIAFVVVILCGGFVAPVFIAGIAALICAFIAKRKIGGQTGDILGATQQVCEISVLVVLSV